MNTIKTYKGRMLRMTLGGGQARCFLCDTKDLAQGARDIHNASNVCSAAMARMLSAGAMLGASLKDEGDTITATINGGGPAGAMTVVARANGQLKVTMGNPQVELPLKENGTLDVGGALGKEGRLTVMRSLGFGEPYVGQVNLVSGEVAEDFAMYYTASEQIPSLCALGALVGEDIRASGGILIQAMPGCTEEIIHALEIRAELFSGLSQTLMESTLEEIVKSHFRGLDPQILEQSELTLQCDCSRARIEQVLLSVGEKDLRQMIEEDHGAELTCHFCRTAYQFSQEELEELLAQGKSAGSEE